MRSRAAAVAVDVARVPHNLVHIKPVVPRSVFRTTWASAHYPMGQLLPFKIENYRPSEDIPVVPRITEGDIQRNAEIREGRGPARERPVTGGCAAYGTR